MFFLLCVLTGISPALSYGEEISSDNPSITLTVGDRSFSLPMSRVFSWQRTELSATLDPEYRSEWENTRLCDYDTAYCDAFLLEQERVTRRIESTSDLQAQEIESYLQDLKSQVDTNTQASTIEPTQNPSKFIFHRGQDGMELFWDKNLETLTQIAQDPSNFLDTPVELAFGQSPAKLSDSAQVYGITGRVGEGVSNFKGSTQNRIFNINRALEDFSGVLIKPGETFSFTETLGPVDESTGYREELVIRNNATELEYGGGICQVSTTFFRASVNAGLEIIARRNHSYPVSYYTPVGFDAAVYSPKPDLLIKNNFSHNVLFVAFIDGDNLHFEVYGTPDGRMVDVTHPIITERRDDGGLRTEFTQTVKDKDGNILIDRTFKSNYNSPDKYPRPGEESIFTEKPKDWSKRQWKEYKKTHSL